MTSVQHNSIPKPPKPLRFAARVAMGLGLVLAFAVPVVAQNQSLTSGILPEASLTIPIGERWYTSAKVESIHGFYFNPANAESFWDYQHQRTDLQLYGGVKLNPKWKLAVGYLYRVRSAAANSHRSIQEASVKQNLAKSTLGHRFRLDQTFTPNTPWQFRVRYRFDIKVPLKGEAIAPGDCFLAFSDEVLYSIQNRVSDFENRFVATLGHQISKKSAIQAGFDYRTDKYLTTGFRHRLWLKVGLSLSL